jgi:hypothetical protein
MDFVMDKDKPGMGSERGLNLSAVRLMAVRSTNCSLKVVTQVKA